MSQTSTLPGKVSVRWYSLMTASVHPQVFGPETPQDSTEVAVTKPARHTQLSPNRANIMPVS